MKLLIAFLLFCSVALGDLATVVPDADNTTGSWTVTPLFSKIDDDIDTPDAVTIGSPNNPSSPTNNMVFDITCPANVGTVTEANLRVRAAKLSGAREISLAVSWSATAATSFNTGALSFTIGDFSSGNQAGLSINKATCDASTLTIAPTTTGGGAATTGVVDTLNLDITYTASVGRREVQITQSIHLERLQ